ncbi:hypothetical protein HK098_007040 [Nowakowskiella sp. JEL0407]|nr:hypothetical protein HK098_007040 [Nowakowskiella sp. JEL0407]
MDSQKFDAMLSYAWKEQHIILNLRKDLESRGFKIWMDVDEISGDIYASMANAIENSAVFIACISKEYDTRRNPQMELTYATQLGVPIIPVRLCDERMSAATEFKIAGKFYVRLLDAGPQNLVEWKKSVDAIEKELIKSLEKLGKPHTTKTSNLLGTAKNPTTLLIPFSLDSSLFVNHHPEFVGNPSNEIVFKQDIEPAVVKTSIDIPQLTSNNKVSSSMNEFFQQYMCGKNTVIEAKLRQNLYPLLLDLQKELDSVIRLPVIIGGSYPLNLYMGDERKWTSTRPDKASLEYRTISNKIKKMLTERFPLEKFEFEWREQPVVLRDVYTNVPDDWEGRWEITGSEEMPPLILATLDVSNVPIFGIQPQFVFVNSDKFTNRFS